MEKTIIRDVILLAHRARPAEASDLGTADDLLDTLRANAERCVGLAANMIGEPVSIIAFLDGGSYEVMLNPEITKRAGPYETEEGCLSLDGVRKTKRWRSIKVRWQTREFKWRVKNFDGFTAEIIQHEIDHLNGIII